MAVPDHLVLATRDLDAGSAWVERQLGAPLANGGKHVRMGTHNRLLKLGASFYLELIAIDPQAPPPGRARWFGLDRLDLPPDRPRLIHWVARTDDIAREVTACGQAATEILTMERGEYRWRIGVSRDGNPPGDGLLPTLIQWDVPVHPADRLPDAGCRLMKLEAFHSRPDEIRGRLAALNLGASLDLHSCAAGEAVQMVAYLRCPRGLVELD